MITLHCPHCTRGIHLYTTADAATITGLAERTIRQRILQLSLGIGISRDYLLTAADLHRLQAARRPRGRPRRG